MENETITMEVMDVSGRRLLNAILQVADHSATLQIDVPDGVYFVTLVNRNNEKAVHKLVIVH